MSLLPSPACTHGHLASEILSEPPARHRQEGELGAAGGLQEPLTKGHLAEDSGLILVTGSIQELKICQASGEISV